MTFEKAVDVSRASLLEMRIACCFVKNMYGDKYAHFFSLLLLVELLTQTQFCSEAVLVKESLGAGGLFTASHRGQPG